MPVIFRCLKTSMRVWCLRTCSILWPIPAIDHYLFFLSPGPKKLLLDRLAAFVYYVFPLTGGFPTKIGQRGQFPVHEPSRDVRRGQVRLLRLPAHPSTEVSFLCSEWERI